MARPLLNSSSILHSRSASLTPRPSFLLLKFHNIQPALHRRLHHSLTRARAAGEKGDSSGEESPESLFRKELKRRGISPTSLLEDDDRKSYSSSTTGTKTLEDDNEDVKKVDQRAISMAMNSEGLEGLIPRAKVLLTLGGTFFIAFWPFILATLAFSTAVYIYFGPTFVHGGNKQMSQPTYIDPYKLLEDQRFD